MRRTYPFPKNPITKLSKENSVTGHMFFEYSLSYSSTRVNKLVFIVNVPAAVLCEFKGK